MKKLVLIAFLLIGVMGHAQKQKKPPKQYVHSIEYYQQLKQRSLTAAFVGSGLVVTGAVLVGLVYIKIP
jgi:hypothetical protein